VLVCLLNVVELPKADKVYPRAGSVLAQWVAYFKHWHEERVMQQIQHPPVQQAYQHLRALSADKKAWYRQLAREMAGHDEATFREEKEEAEARGEARGEAKGRVAVLREFLQAKFGELPPSAEDRLQTAMPDQLLHWTKRVLTASTLEQVFSDH